MFMKNIKMLDKKFNQYAGSQIGIKQTSFINHVPDKKLMTAGEMIKFLRDHNVPNLLVKGDEVVHLIKSVNIKILC